MNYSVEVTITYAVTVLDMANEDEARNYVENNTYLEFDGDRQYSADVEIGDIEEEEDN
jgi:hypothetical protein